MPQPWPASSPDQTNVIGSATRRRRPEAPEGRDAQDLGVSEVLEDHAVENVLPGRQAGEIHPCREVAFRQRRRPHHALEIRERGGRRILDDQPGGAIRAAPDHRAIRGDVAALHAGGHAGAHPIGGDHRRRRRLAPDGSRAPAPRAMPPRARAELERKARLESPGADWRRIVMDHPAWLYPRGRKGPALIPCSQYEAGAADGQMTSA